MLDESLSRRTFLKIGAFTSLSLLAPLRAFAEDGEKAAEGKPSPRGAVIVLWLAGGPSQFETFDPKPGTKAGGETRAIKTKAEGVEIAHLYPRLAEEMQEVALVRSLVTPEGEHERGTYLLRTGYRPNPTVIHPSLGAVCAKELADPALDIPAHVGIGGGPFGVPRGGLLGARFDAFHTYDPRNPLPDISMRVPTARMDDRLDDLKAVDAAFAQGRSKRVEATGHADLALRARATMTSPRLAAFDYGRESKAL